MIINTHDIRNIYVACRYADMRKSIDGLAAIVQLSFDMDVMDHSLFIFSNRARTRIKMLYYEYNGFWLFTRRIEQGRFQMNEHPEKHVMTIDEHQLSRLIEGMAFETFRGAQSDGRKVIIM